MRRPLISLTLLLLLAQLASAQQTLTNADQLPAATGPVKTVRTAMFNALRKAGRWVEGEREYLNDTNYSEDKSKVEVINYSIDGQSVVNSEVFSFDPQGKILSYVLHGRDGQPTGTRVIYKYGTDGRLSESEHYLTGTFTKRGSFSYSLDGRRVEVQFTSAAKNGPYQKDVSVYDSSGRVIESSSHIITKGVAYLIHKNIYRYDSKGNLLGYRTYAPQDVLVGRNGLAGIVEFEYEFDGRGNWTKQIVKAWKQEMGGRSRVVKPVEIIKRTITYY